MTRRWVGMGKMKVNNRFFRHASPRLWNELPKELVQPVDDESPSLSSHLSLTSSSSSPLVLLQTQNTFSIYPSHHSLSFRTDLTDFYDHFRTVHRFLFCYSTFLIFFCLIRVRD